MLFRSNNSGDGLSRYNSKVQVKLMGFGSAREFPRKDAAGSRGGAADISKKGRNNIAYYVAPEVLVGRFDEQVGPPSDIYSWGVVSYEVFSQAELSGVEHQAPDNNAYYAKVVCQNNKKGTRTRPGQEIFDDNNEKCRSLFAEAWKSDPKQRPSPSRIKNRLDTVIEQEQLMLEAHHLARSLMVFV